MRMTNEADYAIRIIYCIGMSPDKIGAKDIAEQTGVSLRFSLKILRKLIQAELIASYKGVKGGYVLKKAPEEISLGEIIECIDGPIQIAHCLSNEFDCTRVGNKDTCGFHRVFDEINHRLREDLNDIRVAQFLPGSKK